MSNAKKSGLANLWYRESLWIIPLLPFSALFYCIVKIRRFCYRAGLKKSHRMPAPVIVVGNLTVGGTGKTPLVIWLANLLKDHGYRPGIISRGYGGKSATWPRLLNADSTPGEMGDEPVLIHRQTGLPVAVGPDRVASAQKLLSNHDCNIIISDDGLQHYKLHRDIELVVIDGDRRFGNGYLLPAGPLREPESRLGEVDYIIVNGVKSSPKEISMRMEGDVAVNLKSGEIKPLAEFNGINCRALAGIGNPARFFAMLAAKGLHCSSLAFPDHYSYQPGDIEFGDDLPVLMTEKDAVKCRPFADLRHWCVPVKAEPDPELAGRLLEQLN